MFLRQRSESVTVKILLKANDEPELPRLVPTKIHSMGPTSAANNVTINTRSFFERP